MYVPKTISATIVSKLLYIMHTWFKGQNGANYSMINTRWILNGTKSNQTASSWDELVNYKHFVQWTFFQRHPNIFSFSMHQPASNVRSVWGWSDFRFRPDHLNEISTSSNWNVLDHYSVVATTKIECINFAACNEQYLKKNFISS